MSDYQVEIRVERAMDLPGRDDMNTKHNEIKPGAYRALFIDACSLYRATAQADEIPVIDHYLRLLDNPSYKFGKPETSGGYTDFFRS